METKNLLRISIIIAVIGIAALFFITNISIEKVDIADAGKYMGSSVKIEGNINSVFTSKDGHVFFKVSDNSGSIDVVAFKNYNLDGVYNLKKGQEIEVRGIVQEYKGKLEIIAKEITD